MEVTDVKVNKNVKNDGRFKGYASVVLDGELVIQGIKIIKGDERLFLAMPSRKNFGKFADIIHPITQKCREKIETAVFKEYYK